MLINNIKNKNSGLLYRVIFTMFLICICAAPGMIKVIAKSGDSYEGADMIQVAVKGRADGKTTTTIEGEELAKIHAIVETLGLWRGEFDRIRIIKTYNQFVSSTKRGAMDIYEGHKKGKTVGYALEIIYRSKHGLIKGILTIGPDCDKILAFRIYKHNEPQEYGGKLASKEWLSQFENIPLVTDGRPGIVISSEDKGPNIIKDIPGASETIAQICRIINMAIIRFLAGGIMLEELDLEIDIDAVTMATPGIQIGLKPSHIRKEIRRLPFMVPPGMKNLALYKPVVSSEEPIIGIMDQINDGLKNSDEFDYVELGPGHPWCQIDMGNIYTIYAVVIWHYYKNAIIYNDVIIQVADDAEFSQNVRILFNNDHDNSAGLGKGNDAAFYTRWWGEIVDARGANYKGTKTRFVRVYTGNGMEGELPRFVEVAVYGK